jgi:DNA-binding transcriptional LysR family regulator
VEWQQLEYFHTVARLQHMTLASEALAISQPALSRAIGRLERELGVPLFERNGRSIALNRYGRLFLRRADRMLKEFAEGKQELEDLLHPERGELSLGFLHTLGVQSVPDLIKAFRDDHPDIRFQLHQNSTQYLLDQLASGDVDLVLASPRETKLQIRWAELWSEELFVVVPNGHRLAGSGSIQLEDIRGEPIISFKQGYGLRKITDKLFQEAGFSPDIRFEGEEAHTIAGLVAAGLGVAILPEMKGIDSGLTLLSVRNPGCRRAIGIAWMEGRYLSPAAERFRQFVIDYIRS